MSKTKTVEWDELRTKNTAESAWLCIEGKVYDVTDFLDEHPGGEEVMLEVAGMEQRDAATSSRGGPFLTAIAAARFCLNPGKDATEEYVDVGHSDDARRMLEGSEAKIKLVGKVVRAGSESRERERERERERTQPAGLNSRAMTHAVLRPAALRCFPISSARARLQTHPAVDQRRVC